jgi:hypothetical protein
MRQSLPNLPPPKFVCCLSSSRACNLGAQIFSQAIALKAASEESVTAAQKHNDFIRKEMVKHWQILLISLCRCPSLRPRKNKLCATSLTFLPQQSRREVAVEHGAAARSFVSKGL